MHLSLSLRTVLMAAVFCCFPVSAFADSFIDVPPSSPLFASVEALVMRGAIAAGGFFRANALLTRAEAVTMLLLPVMKPDDLAKITVSSFLDISPDALYMRYAEAARMRKIIGASSLFHADGPVTKAAFIKMLLSTNKTDSALAFSDIREPLSSDVLTSTEWYYAPMRYAVAASMTAAGKDGRLAPSRNITRGDTALILDRFHQFLAGQRTQVLLAQTESEIARVLALLNRNDLQSAGYAAARSLLTARGALTLSPNEPVVQAALKIAKGFQSLVLASKAQTAGKPEDAIQFAKEAYAAGDKAEGISPKLSSVAQRLRTMAKNLADEARKVQAAKQQ